MIGRLKPPARLPRALHAALRKGIRVELEHTDDRRTAMVIASHHLAECPFYYEMLEVMEKECRRMMKRR